VAHLLDPDPEGGPIVGGRLPVVARYANILHLVISEAFGGGLEQQVGERCANSQPGRLDQKVLECGFGRKRIRERCIG
jgi:hypothetical protein